MISLVGCCKVEICEGMHYGSCYCEVYCWILCTPNTLRLKWITPTISWPKVSKSATPPELFGLWQNRNNAKLLCQMYYSHLSLSMKMLIPKPYWIKQLCDYSNGVKTELTCSAGKKKDWNSYRNKSPGWKAAKNTISARMTANNSWRAQCNHLSLVVKNSKESSRFTIIFNPLTHVSLQCQRIKTCRQVCPLLSGSQHPRIVFGVVSLSHSQNKWQLWSQRGCRNKSSHVEVAIELFLPDRTLCCKHISARIC